MDYMVSWCCWVV